MNRLTRDEFKEILPYDDCLDIRCDIYEFMLDWTTKELKRQPFVESMARFSIKGEKYVSEQKERLAFYTKVRFKDELVLNPDLEKFIDELAADEYRSVEYWGCWLNEVSLIERWMQKRENQN